ncbi:MAG: hypothetical protein IT158_05995 [Bryobacterales bacterium]|nr:hypothetical protein [Bryobacterales bacterium]
MAQPSFLYAAGQWFLHSGIQHTTGGVARYYRSDLQENRAISTEITGYAAGALVYLHRLTGEPAYLDKAILAGRFLTRLAWDRRLETFPFEYARDGMEVEPLAYFFDTGIIVRGLLALWRATGDTEFKEAARNGGLAMARDFAAADGQYEPILRLPEKAPLERECRWSRSPGCYQLKAAMAWHELFEETGEADFEGWYEALLGQALRTHESFLPGDADRARVMDRLHAYSYFLEGLLPVLDREACARAFNAGLARAAALLSEIAPVFERSDVIAQLLRVRLLGEAAGIAHLDGLAGEAEARSLSSFQMEHFDLRIKGGFYFGRKEGRLLPFVNPVSTAFGLQALAMWQERRAGRLATTRQMLI